MYEVEADTGSYDEHAEDESFGTLDMEVEGLKFTDAGEELFVGEIFEDVFVDVPAVRIDEAGEQGGEAVSSERLPAGIGLQPLFGTVEKEDG